MPDMDDAEIKRLREKHVEWSEGVGRADEVKNMGETLLMAAPSNLLVRLIVWLVNWAHGQLVKGEENARIAARKTYD